MTEDLRNVDLAHGEVTNLEDLIDRESLREVCRSFFDLFGLSIRVFSSRGSLLANVHEERAVCRYVNSTQGGRVACARTVAEVQVRLPEGGTTIEHGCFTGAVYHIVPINYDSRQLGRIVLGPFLPALVEKPPKSLLVIDSAIDPQRAQAALAEMPRVRMQTAERIAKHLQGVLDLILFSGHRAHLTSAMHLATVRENYRELSLKNASLQQAFDKLSELDRLKSNFLATVSHELRTPLTSIIGYSEMLSAGMVGDLNTEQQSFIDTIRSKGELLLTLITSLLDLNKLERGQLVLEPETVDPRAVLKEVRDTYVPEAERRNLTLDVRCDDDVPNLRVDPIRLRQILINLASNAVKFTPDGGRVTIAAKAAEIHLSGAEDSDGEDGSFGAALMMAPEGAVEFSVEDTGIGIPDNQLDRIFDAFYQVDGSSTREFGGAGLGLSIAKNLVDAHHGRIRVESTPGSGSRFVVTLPERPPEDE